ncbi:MAG TPA: DNA polymerase III subunit gamma/tau [Abditibacteriaceae bacterium]|jgi:DNA polymerase-3 subunit gamma/tau
MKAENFHPSSFRLHPFTMSLYRKYRPQTFEDVVGQEHIAQTLRNAVGAGRTAHAYLFCGPRGTGKTTSARLLAKCLNCSQGPTSTPCNECDFCTRVRDNQAVMDLVEIDAASNTGVDNVRENIIEKVNVAPAQGRYRVYIIDEVHMLSASSFNALLKTLEEPPAHAVFVLATTDAHKVPTTITSRCQRFDFRRVGPGDIVKRLQYVAQSEKIELLPDAARLIALTADGALRDALTLLEQVAAFSPETIGEADVRLVLGTVSVELMHALMEAVATRDAVGVLRQIEAATEEGASFSQLARDLINYTRDLLLLTVGFESSHLLTDSEKKLRHRYADHIGRARLMQLVDALRSAEKEMRQSTDHRLLLELTLVRAATAPELLVAPTVQAVQAPVSQGPMIAPQRSTPREAVKTAPVQTPIQVPVQETPVESLEETFGEIAVVQPAAIPLPVEPLEKSEAYLEEPAVTEMVDLPAPTIEHQASSIEPSDSQPEWSPTPAKKGRRIHDLSEFIELWPAVLVRFTKKIGITSVAYLHDALPVALDEKDAVLEFKKEFHYAKACDAAKRLPFEQVLNECMAKPRRLVFRLAEPKPVAPVIEEAEPVVEDDDFDADVSQTTTDVHKYAQTVFAAEVVGRSGEG